MELCYAIPATLTLVYIVYRLLFKGAGPGKNAPPSLPSLPIVGSLPFLSGVGTIHNCFMEKAKRHGNVFTFEAGGKMTLVINGHEAIQEALVKRSADFAGRGTVYSERTLWNVDLLGITYKQYGEGYKTNRFHSLAVLKQFGFGDRRTMELKIQSEVEHLLQYFRDRNGNAFDPSDIFNLASLNVIHDLMFSERFSLGDPSEIFLRKRVKEWVDSLDLLYDLFPVVVHLPKNKKRLDAVRESTIQWSEFLKKKIHDSVKKEEADDNFVREYIKLVGKDYDERELNYILRDFIIGGTETTATQLCWAVILLGNHPDVLRRLQTELDAVVSRERLPSMDDKPKMPIMEAAILEILRIRLLSPLGVPHATLCDTMLSGYNVPKNIGVIANLYSANMDPEVWSEPDIFRPERFLDANGKVVKRELVLSFGLGKRACIGEGLAMQELFLFLTAIVQQFDILPPEGKAKIRNEMKIIKVVSPAPFEVRFMARA